MLQSQFHAYYAARMLACATEEDALASVFASSNIQVYPFQIAAASFALRSPYQKGAILCDEAGMGKSHEAMLIMNQRWMEGRNRILLCIPNADLLVQWTDLLERCYSVPYVTMTSRSDWVDYTDDEHPNGFEQDGIVITTYDFAAEHEAEASAVAWDIVVFEEANALSGVYREDNRQARALWRIAGNAFKLLLTGTPIAYNELPTLFYYWDGRRNKRYQSQKVYGMSPDFKPRHGRITLSSIVGRGILNELECANEGTMLVQGDVPACSVGLYHVELNAGDRHVSEQAVLVGQTDDGKLLSQEECCALLALPVVTVEHRGRMTPHWLKGSGAQEALDALVPVDDMIAAQQQKLSPAQEEVIEAYRLETKAKKAALTHEIDDLAEKIRKAEAERDAMTADRLRILAMNRQINQLRQAFMKKQESQFFDAMRLDMELEGQIKKFTEAERLTATVTREFIVRIENKHV